MLQFPDPKRREEKTLGPRESSSRWQFLLRDLRGVIFPGTAAFRLGLADSPRSFTDGEVASIVHGEEKSSL